MKSFCGVVKTFSNVCLWVRWVLCVFSFDVRLKSRTVFDFWVRWRRFDGNTGRVKVEVPAIPVQSVMCLGNCSASLASRLYRSRPPCHSRLLARALKPELVVEQERKTFLPLAPCQSGSVFSWGWVRRRKLHPRVPGHLTHQHPSSQCTWPRGIIVAWRRQMESARVTVASATVSFWRSNFLGMETGWSGMTQGDPEGI